MNDFDIISKECEINLLKINHLCESEFDSFKITLGQNIFNIDYFTESEFVLYYENTVSELGQKISSAIEGIIKVIQDFIDKLKNKILSAFDNDKKRKLNEAAKNLTSEQASKKVKIYSSKKEKEALDEFIREVAKLERRLLSIKVDIKYRSYNASNAFTYADIERQITKLEKKYDDVISGNEELVEMALKDAIRFSEKELNSVKIDYDAVKNQSDEILQRFKKDANGCDIPIKLNLIQKMANKISTRVRKYLTKHTTRKHRNLSIVIGLAATVGAIKLGVNVARYDPEIRDKIVKSNKVPNLAKVALYSPANIIPATLQTIKSKKGGKP